MTQRGWFAQREFNVRVCLSARFDRLKLGSENTTQTLARRFNTAADPGYSVRSGGGLLPLALSLAVLGI